MIPARQPVTAADPALSWTACNRERSTYHRWLRIDVWYDAKDRARPLMLCELCGLMTLDPSSRPAGAVPPCIRSLPRPPRAPIDWASPRPQLSLRGRWRLW